MNPTTSFELTRAHAPIGALIALCILTCWGALLTLSLVVIPWKGATWALAPLVVLAQTFLYTGLFISAHDAMHRTLCWRNQTLNDALGQLALFVYALFSLKKLLSKHREHHAHPASADDPDFHDGTRRSFWGWYATFLWRYVSWWQILGMASIFNVLAHVAHIPEGHLLLFWVLPSLLSTLQLFYFGTYLTHKDPPDPAIWGDEHRARSNDMPPWLSFLTCYHFGYHWEHHDTPHAPWWLLPRVRAATLQRIASAGAAPDHHSIASPAQS